MAKIDGLKEEIATKRVYLDKFIILAIAVLTGIITTIYQVISGKVPLYMLFIVVVGFISLTIVVMGILRVNEFINEKIKELENA